MQLEAAGGPCHDPISSHAVSVSPVTEAFAIRRTCARANPGLGAKSVESFGYSAMLPRRDFSLPQAALPGSPSSSHSRGTLFWRMLALELLLCDNPCSGSALHGLGSHRRRPGIGRFAASRLHSHGWGVAHPLPKGASARGEWPESGIAPPWMPGSSLAQS